MNHCKSNKLGLILSLVLLIGLSGTAFGASPSAYWQLDDAQDGPYNDTLTQGSDNEAECVTSIRCPAFEATGNVGAAQTFDGANDGLIVDAVAGADSVFDLQDDANFSVEVWFHNVNAAGLGGDGDTEVLVGRSDNTDSGDNDMQWWIGVRNVGGTIQAAARLIDQEGDGAGVLITKTGTPVDVTAAGWHQAILVKNGNEVSLYVDDTLEDTQTINYTTDQTRGGLTSTAAPLSIGLLQTISDGGPSDGSWFDGDIDQVAFYNQALTVADVNASFTAGSNNEALEFEPVFTTIDFGDTALGYTFSTNVNAAASPAITGYTMGTVPTGLVVHPTTGAVTWVPTNLDIGEAVFNVSATNPVGTTAQDLSVMVVDFCAPASLDAYWDLDETAAPFDGALFIEPPHPHVNDATCIGGTDCPTVDADTEAVNGALAFNGTDQGLEVAASGAKDKVFDWAANESFTISMFMKPDIAGFTDDTTEVMIGRWLTGVDSPQWWIGLRDDVADATVAPRLAARLESVNGDGNATLISDATTPTTILDDTWYHVALVYDHTAGTVSLYLEGVLEAMENITFDAGTDFAEETNPLNIGYLFNGTANGDFWGGSLDEIAFFGEALDAAVLLQHATQNEGRGFCNDAPAIAASPAPTLTAQAGVEYTYAPVAEADEEGDTVTWTLITAPDDMEIDDATGAVSWTPTNADAGANPVTVRVSDSFGGADEKPFTITVTASDNTAPVISGQAAASIAVDATYTIEVANLTITDPDSTTFTLTVLAGTDYTVSGATVTPDSGFTGTLTVPVTVNDGISDSAQFGFVITVGGSTGGGGGGGGCFIDSTMD